MNDSARALSLVLTELLADRALPAIDAATLAWDQPMLVLRSAHMGRLQAFLDTIRGRLSAPLHVMSHARDEAAVRAAAGATAVFHAYPTPGRYRLEDVPAALLEDLRRRGFGTIVFLDAGSDGEGLDDVQRLLGAIDEPRVVAYRGNGEFAAPDDWRRYRLASAAFYRLIEWYHFRLDPGFPDGPVVNA